MASSALEWAREATSGGLGCGAPWSALERRFEGLPHGRMPGDAPAPWDLDSADEYEADHDDLSGDEALEDADATTQHGTPSPRQ